MLPDKAALYVAGGGSEAGGLGFWKDVYGFDMSPVAEAMQEAALHDAVSLLVSGDRSNFCTSACIVGILQD